MLDLRYEMLDLSPPQADEIRNTCPSEAIEVPIPAQDRVQFSSALPLKQAGMLRLFDLSGKEVRQQVWQERMGDNQLDVQQLANGLYYYTIILGQQHYYGKLSVQH